MEDVEGERTPRDFFSRGADEQQAFLEQTWCDNCQQVNSGMVEPHEYELKGVIYIEGKCKVCGTVILTELTDEDF
ncbi:MAG: hypothetical protein OIF57_12420 [Marinobacterium sp.]|nr:hypothetical protein [Marinobacterium sp.]